MTKGAKKSASNRMKLSSTEKLLLKIGVAALIVSALGTCYLLYNYNVVSSSIPNNTEEQREYSQGDIENTVRALAFEKDVTTATYQQAKDKDKDTINTYIKDKRDLNAQEGMWNVATELLWITTIQLFIFIVSIIGSFAGLYLLYRTLRDTRKTLKATRKANKISQSTHRAWCNFALSKYATGYREAGKIHTFHYRIVNGGSTPANKVRQEFVFIDKSEFKIATEKGFDSINDLITSAEPNAEEVKFLFHFADADLSNITVESPDKKGTLHPHKLSKEARCNFIGIDDNFKEVYLVARLTYSPYLTTEVSSVIKIYKLTFIEDDGWSSPNGHKKISTVRIRETTDMQIIGEK